MKKIPTWHAVLAGIFGWISFLLADSICYTLLCYFHLQPAFLVASIVGAIAARFISYSFARNKAVGFCIPFLVLTAAAQYAMGARDMMLSAAIAAVFLLVFWLVGNSKPANQTQEEHS